MNKDEMTVESIIFGLKTELAEKKKEIERLTEENEGRFHYESHLLNMNDNLNDEIADLKKQVYEYKRKIEQGTLKEIPDNAVVLTPAERDEEMRLIREDVIARMEATRKETAEKFALKLADYFVEHCGGRLCISLTLQEWYKMIDEICK